MTSSSAYTVLSEALYRDGSNEDRGISPAISDLNTLRCPIKMWQVLRTADWLRRGRTRTGRTERLGDQGSWIGRQMDERLGNWAINQKVAGSIPGHGKMTLCPWARHFTLVGLGGMSLYLLSVALDKSVC